MKLYVGIDLHSTNSMITVIDEKDKIIYERRIANNIGMILAALSPYGKEIEAIAIESTYNWYWLVDGLMEEGYNVKLVNTAAVKIYEGLKYSSDEHDARHLAHLLRLGILPTGYIYPKEDRSVRDLLRKRGQLVRCRTAQILSIQNLVTRNCGKGISVQEIKELEEGSISEICGGDDARSAAIRSNRAVVKCLNEQISILEKQILTRAKIKPEYKKLLTVDGVGKILGLTIMYETGPMDRFKKVGDYTSYARCVTSQRLSNGKKKGEGNRKNGNKYLAWAFVEAAHFAVRYQENIRRFHQRKKAKTNSIIAIKAVAHKLARASYHVLKDQVTFDVTRAFA